jgi:hypothetical protein
VYFYISIVTCLYSAFFVIFKDHNDEKINISQKLLYYVIFQIGIELGLLSFNSESLEHYPVSLLQSFLPVLTILIFHATNNLNRKTVPLSCIIAFYMLLPLPGTYLYSHQLDVVAHDPEFANFFLFTNIINSIVLANLFSKIFLKFRFRMDENLHNVMLIILMILPGIKYFSIDQLFFFQKAFSIIPLMIIIFLGVFIRNLKPNILFNLYDFDELFKLPEIRTSADAVYKSPLFFDRKLIEIFLVSVEKWVRKYGLLLIFSTIVLIFILLY